MERRPCFVVLIISTFFIILLANSVNAQCQITACPANYQPVCGKAQQNSKSSQSEFRSFSNQCEMEAENCRSKGSKKWELFSSQQCPETTVTNGPEETCNSFCTDDFRPVCGKNGNEYKTFPNRCNFDIEKCKSSEWRFVRNGNCPISSRNRKKNCNINCPEENTKPVCGINGNEMTTFPSRCHFRNAQCKSPGSWRFVRDGICVSSAQPTAQPALPQCNSFCTADYRPVCGRNGNEMKTFPNRCSLTNEQCKSPAWKYERDGQCLNSQLPTPFPTTEIVSCNSFCTADFRPVCGRNGNELKTFPNRCNFDYEKCKSPAWKSERNGQCLNSQLPTPFPTTEIISCNSFCTADFRPVCGRNGNELKTFSNRCNFDNEKCKYSGWTFVRNGECSTGSTKTQSNCKTFCPYDYSPVCGRNGNEVKTFPNRCGFTNEQCRSPEWKFEREGDCLEPLINSSPTPSECNSICPANYNPVCGRNGNEVNTFSNRCNFDNAKCNLSSWTFVRDGKCNTVTTTSSPTKRHYRNDIY